MGIRCLSLFAERNGFFQDFQLHDTELVIDKANLMVTFTEHFKSEQNKYFSGDYNKYSHQLRHFFTVLKQCNVKMIIVGESQATNDSQMSKKLTRLDKINLFTDTSKTGNNENIIKVKNLKSSTVLGAKVFNDVLNEFEFEDHISSAEADDLITELAFKRNASILSDDSDFFFADLPAGVILITFLLENYKVCTNEKGVHYINCKRYTVDQFELKFSGLDRKMLSIFATPLFDFAFSPILEALTNFSTKFQRMEQMWALFDWLSKTKSVESTIQDLENKFQSFSELKPLIEKIKTNILANNKMFNKHIEKDIAFKTEVLPKYLNESPNKDILKRVLRIYVNRKDLFYPTVEDPSLNKSAFTCSFKLCYQIYGILRETEDVEIDSQVTQYFCEKEKFLGRKVKSEFYEKITNTKLPSIWEIEHLSEETRLNYFWNILEIDSTLQTKLLKIFKTKFSEQISKDEKIQFNTVFISFIYFERNLKTELSIEFIYSLLLNILLSGNIEKSKINANKPFCFFTNPPDLSKYDFVASTLEDFNPRITYFSNAFQNCLKNICFLAQILNLRHFWHVNKIIFGLQGTLVYNLTKELMQSEKPWVLLKYDVIKNKQDWSIYKKLVVLALEFGERKLNFSFDEKVIPQFKQTIKKKQKRLIKEFKKQPFDSSYTNKFHCLLLEKE